MRALVTGGAGFIGSHLCGRLVDEGHRVVALDDLSGSTGANLAELGGVELIVGDIRDRELLVSVARGADVIFHLAAMRSVPRSLEQPEAFTDVNVMGSLNVLLAGQEVGAAVVCSSSSSVYGDQEPGRILDEGQLPSPRSPYAASKAAGEAYVSAFAAAGVRAVALRYFNVYGPWQDPNGSYAAVVPRFIAACLSGRAPVIHGDGEQARDFTYVDDVVDANLRAAGAGAVTWGRAFNVGAGGEPTTVNALLAKIAGLLRVQPRPRHEPPRPGDIRRTQADVSAARTAFGYRPTVAIDEGLERTVTWFREDATPAFLEEATPA